MRSDSDDLPSVTPADRLIRRTCSQALEIHLQRGSHGSEIRFRHAPDNARRDLPRSGRRPFDRQGQCLLNRSRKEGSVNGAPDFAPVTLVVTNIGKTTGEAIPDNAKAASALVSLIKAQGVAPADIQTSNLSISHIFSQPSRGQATAPTITGYSVSNTVALKFHDIPRLGGLLDRAVTAGANSVSSVGFDHADPSALLDKARALAVADATRKANVYAAGAKIGRPMTLTEEQGRTPTARYLLRAYTATAAVPTPIEAAKDKLTVTARFALAESNWRSHKLS
jgi:uncharacterized protein